MHGATHIKITKYIFTKGANNKIYSTVFAASQVF
jgi:hypothetical protein